MHVWYLFHDCNSKACFERLSLYYEKIIFLDVIIKVVIKFVSQCICKAILYILTLSAVLQNCWNQINVLAIFELFWRKISCLFHLWFIYCILKHYFFVYCDKLFTALKTYTVMYVYKYDAIDVLSFGIF